jgi:hypothetical protein
MKGDKVIVRTFGNKAVVCRVWEADAQIVAVCSPQNYEALSRGDEGLWPVGFPREDVYRYNPQVDLDVPVSWGNLNLYE